MDKTDEIIVSVDLGGTNVRAALVDASGELLNVSKRSVSLEAATPEIVPDIIKEISAGSDVSSAVIGLPGLINYTTQEMVNPPNLPERWVSYLTKQWLEEQSGLSVQLANDADLAAVGEAYFGGGKGLSDIIFVTISTGVGGGVVLGGKLVHGKLSANDMGHITVDYQAAIAGKRYTPELLGSGTGLAATAASLGLAEETEALAALVRSGDPQAVKVWNEGLQAVAAGIASVAWIYAPELIVIGGGVGLNADITHPVIADFLKNFGPEQAGLHIPLAAASLGDDAGLVGGAAWHKAFA